MSQVWMQRAFGGAARTGVHSRDQSVICRALVALLCGVASGGCSLISETDAKQCKQTSDCSTLFGPTAPYLCEQDYCTRPACESDAQCRARGGAFQTSICGGDKRCEPAECTSDDDCGIGGICNIATNHCEARQCEVLADCQVKNPSPTVQCTAGRCVDEVWGCIGQGDNRPLDQTMATIKIPFYDGINRVPISSATVRACQLPAFDPNAATMCTAIPGAVGTYDPAGVATVTGLTPGSLPRIELVPSLAALLPVDFYSQKSSVGETTSSIVTTINTETVRQLVNSYAGGDPTKIVTVPDVSAGATVTVFNCLDKPADRVTLDMLMEDKIADEDGDPTKLPNIVTLITYFGDNLLPDTTRTETNTTGLTSIINMRPAKVLTLKAVVNGTPLQGTPRTMPMTTLQVKVYPGRLTSIHLYPRSYFTTSR